MHAILHIRTSFHGALGKKTLAVFKDPSGRPILLCSLTPRSKQMNKRGAYQRASTPRLRRPSPALSLPIGGDLKGLASPTSYIRLSEESDFRDTAVA